MQKRIWPEGVATLFGVGKSKWAPGTMGSLASLPVIYLMGLMGPYVYMVLCLALIIVAIVASDQYGEGKDLKEIVIDEFVGLMVTLFLVPQTWFLWGLGFVLFRFFDILKPFPISHFDKNVKGGFGVVLDDLVAGLFASALIQFVWLPHLHIDFMNWFYRL